ncbi:MAG: response regulator transcription factor [Candidatus Sericytochromatia bacterium]|nr:response regulator transcription factor [Candidatus Sericytochromatia bacterium]
MKNILLVEDDKLLYEMIIDYLECSGYRVKVAHNGMEAIDIINKDPKINILITDVGMPVLDGMELCRYIRSKPEFNNLPILMMTGKDDLTTKYIGFEAGSDDYIAKPFDPLEFLLRIKSLIRRTELINNTKPDEKEKISVNQEPKINNLVWSKNSSFKINNKTVIFTAVEFDIFNYLYTNHYKMITSEEILHKVMEYPKGAGNPEAIRTHIKNIRLKIEENREKPEIITYISRKGYFLDKTKVRLIY